MIIPRQKHFAKILNTSGMPGFIRGRKYDMDMDRLGRMQTSQRELSRLGDIRKEQRQLTKELYNGNL